MDEREICGNCKYHKYEEIDKGWICTNPDSEYVADWTDYDFGCMDFEEKDDV